MTRRSGFTFVEIVVALAVFGALSAMAVPRYRQMKERAYTAAIMSDLGELRIAEEGFWAENQFYTSDSTQLDWRASSEVLIDVSSSDPFAGFDATARHVRLPGTQCVMSVGRTTASGTPSGAISCGTSSTSLAGSGTAALP